MGFRCDPTIISNRRKELFSPHQQWAFHHEQSNFSSRRKELLPSHQQHPNRFGPTSFSNPQKQKRPAQPTDHPSFRGQPTLSLPPNSKFWGVQGNFSKSPPARSPPPQSPTILRTSSSVTVVSIQTVYPATKTATVAVSAMLAPFQISPRPRRSIRYPPTS